MPHGVLLDWDGTFAHFGTGIPLPGAVATIRKMIAAGAVIVVTTQRSDDRQIRETMLKYSIPIQEVVLNFPSPRLLINDAGAEAINRTTDQPWM
jgi:hypothetical protein